MVWGIIGALDVEVELIKSSMEEVTTESFFGQTYYKGTLDGASVALVQCGIGKINAAICAYTLIDKYKADYLINVGIAGALDEKLKVLDVVVGNELLFHDIDHSVYKKYYPNETVFQSDKNLVTLCETVIDSLNKNITHYTGRIVTGDEFVESTELKNNIVDKYNPLCVEMEGAAIAMVAFMNNTPFLVIRTMSDSADDEAKVSYDNLFYTAAQVSAEIVIKMIKTY